MVTGAIGGVAAHLLLDTCATGNDLDVAFSQTLPPTARPQVLGADALTGTGGRLAA